MSTVRRFYQYRVVGAGGCMKKRLKLGTITIDRWQGKSHTYFVFNLKTMKETGWYEVYCIGDATPEQSRAMSEAWANERKKKADARDESAHRVNNA